jgi:hypothetical protein
VIVSDEKTGQVQQFIEKPQSEHRIHPKLLISLVGWLR